MRKMSGILTGMAKHPSDALLGENNIYEVENLSKAYGETRVLKNVHFRLGRGEQIAIMGPSGSGKSTLLHCLGGVDKADTGRLYFEGNDLQTMDSTSIAGLRRSRVTSIFQFFYLLPTLTVRENIAFPLQLLGLKGKTRKDQVAEMLAHVNMEPRADAYPNELSGGEQQRVAIARALITHPSVVLADEPTGNLDSQNGRRILELIQRLISEQGIALMLVTHSKEAAGICQRTWHMQDGHLQNKTPCQEAKS